MKKNYLNTEIKNKNKKQLKKNLLPFMIFTLIYDFSLYFILLNHFK